MISAPEIAYGIACIFLFLYLVLSSIEFGAAFYMLLPESILERSTVRTYVNPIWETTNIFLIFFVMMIFSCFPRAVPMLSLLIFPIVEAALVFFVFRILGILGLFYGDSGKLVWRILFFVGSWGAALILGGFYHVVVAGTRMSLPPDILTTSLILLIISTMLLLSSTFFLMFTSRHRFHPYLARLSYASLLTWYGAAALYLVGPFRAAPYMLDHLTAATNGFIAVTLVTITIPVFIRQRYFAVGFIASIIAFAMLFFGSAYMHLPYLVYPAMTISDAFTSTAIFHAILLSGAVGALFLIPALYLLYALFGVTQTSADLIE
jgi:cytochrome d ubiquinol oxidase subunit II